MKINKRLESLVGEGGIKKLVPANIWDELEIFFSPCCGLGKKTVRIKDANGYNVSIKAYPVTLNGNTYISQEHLEDNLSMDLATDSYIVALINPRKILILCRRSQKDSLGAPLGIPDFVVKS